MKGTALMRWMLLLLAVVAVPGCATHALWEDADLGTWHEPASDTRMLLYRCNQPADFLVLYQESIEPHDARKLRAYLLHRNQCRIEQQKRPDFARLDSIHGLQAVPVFLGTNSPADSPKLPLYAILATNHSWFTLYCRGSQIGSYSLPVYHDGRGKLERIALTPLAATADATIVGSALGALAGLWYAEGKSGNSGSFGLWPDFDNWGEASFFQPNQ